MATHLCALLDPEIHLLHGMYYAVRRISTPLARLERRSRLFRPLAGKVHRMYAFQAAYSNLRSSMTVFNVSLCLLRNMNLKNYTTIMEE